MIPFSITRPMTAEQTVTATNALLRVARVDAACTQEEVALIRTFYETFATDKPMPPFDTQLRKSESAEIASSSKLSDPEHRDFVMGACVMVAYADGKLSDAERQCIQGLAVDIGLSDQRCGEIIGIVQDFLLSQFARLPDSASVAKVALELR